jgi:hypothetical protein
MLKKSLHAVARWFSAFIRHVMDAQQLRADLYLANKGYVWHEQSGSFRWVGR